MTSLVIANLPNQQLKESTTNLLEVPNENHLIYCKQSKLPKRTAIMNMINL